MNTRRLPFSFFDYVRLQRQAPNTIRRIEAYPTKRTLLSLFVMFHFVVTVSAGSVRRVEISKATQGESPIEFTLTVNKDPAQPGHVRVELDIPPDQEELVHLWKIYLWLREGEKSVLGVALDINVAKDGAMKVYYFGHEDTVRKGIIAVRCGEHAPKVETIYQIDVGSYAD